MKEGSKKMEFQENDSKVNFSVKDIELYEQVYKSKDEIQSVFHQA